MNRLACVIGLLALLVLSGCAAISGQSVATTTGSLTITASTRGAAIGRADAYVDDTYRGRTAITIRNLAPGEHTVRLEKAGYQSATATVQIRAGKRTNIIVPLTPLPKN
ncbi:MAG: PEGA domain-containing protein [Nanoarchaeota archaeon]|nr:PEGA domain-containing protein [Nanoarchaeota archaeon]